MYNSKKLPAKNGKILKIAQDGEDQCLRVVEGVCPIPGVFVRRGGDWYQSMDWNQIVEWVNARSIRPISLEWLKENFVYL